MNMTRAAAVSIHAVSPEFISIGTTHNLPLYLCEEVITSGGEAVLRPCYAGIKQLLRWPPFDQRRPGTMEQAARNRTPLVILSGRHDREPSRRPTRRIWRGGDRGEPLALRRCACPGQDSFAGDRGRRQEPWPALRTTGGGPAGGYG